MRLSPTLMRYFARRFAMTVLTIFGLCMLLILVVDYVEVAQRTFFKAGFSPATLALISAMRVPNVAEAVLPFAMLFGAIATFVTANRRLEFVVARGAGVSAWQFLLPAAIMSVVIGIFATTVFNPIAASLKEGSKQLSAAMFASDGTETSNEGPVWLRQGGPDGESILGARSSLNEGLDLAGVTVFVFDHGGHFRERVDGATATLSGHEWRIESATVTAAGTPPRRVPVYRLETILSPSEVREAFANPDTIGFWDLPQLIRVADQSALPANRFRLQYQSLLARPVLLLAMVLIAAIVSLKFSRAKQLGWMILAGVGIGFVLYVVTEIAKDLGGGGLVPPWLAAWIPALTAMMAGLTVLLTQEDG